MELLLGVFLLLLSIIFFTTVRVLSNNLNKERQFVEQLLTDKRTFTDSMIQISYAMDGVKPNEEKLKNIGDHVFHYLDTLYGSVKQGENDGQKVS